LALGAFCFACLGIAVAFWARTFDQMSAFGGFVLLPLIYLGGVFYSVDHLPGFWRQVSMFNPLLYMINGVRYGVLGHADVTVEVSLGVSVLAFTLMFLLAMRTVRKGSFQRW
jgi:ABC-2 type transport system permease protein